MNLSGLPQHGPIHPALLLGLFGNQKDGVGASIRPPASIGAPSPRQAVWLLSVLPDYGCVIPAAEVAALVSSPFPDTGVFYGLIKQRGA